jgi:hypothetical protein
MLKHTRILLAVGRGEFRGGREGRVGGDCSNKVAEIAVPE